MDLKEIEKAWMKPPYPSRITMAGQIDWLIARIRELDGQLKTSRDAHVDTMNGMGRKVLELKEAIGKVLAWRNFDGDGISDPLRKELYAHLKEG